MTNPNDPAHPQHGWSSDPETIERMSKAGGLTKREYFAAMAMQGVLSHPAICEQMAKLTGSDPYMTARGIAAYAVPYADALIAELSK